MSFDFGSFLKNDVLPATQIGTQVYSAVENRTQQSSPFYNRPVNYSNQLKSGIPFSSVIWFGLAGVAVIAAFTIARH